MVSTGELKSRPMHILINNHFWQKQSKLKELQRRKAYVQMNRALTGSGGEALVKLRIAEALQDKKIVLLPVSEGGMNLKTTDINRLLEFVGLKALSAPVEKKQQ